MIHKRVRASFWNSEGPAVHLLNIYSRGFDTDQLNKLAADESLKFKDIKPEKGYAFVHLITTGAGEYYSCNRNGDFFNEDSCTVSFPKGLNKTAELDGGLKKYHSTFMKYGAVYRNHNNSKKGATPEGSIVMEMYNEPMHRGELVVKLPEDKWRDDLEKLASGGSIYFSMGCGVASDQCFVRDTLIETRDGFIPIQDIQIDDEVLTHKGRYRPVRSTMSRKYTGKMVSIKVQDTHRAISDVTSEHPFLVIKEKDMRSCRGSNKGLKRRHSFSGKNICKVCGVTRPEPAWLAASEIESGDYLVYPRYRGRDKYYNESRAYLYGMYLGDGTVFSPRSWRNHKGPRVDRGIVITLNLSETDILNNLVKHSSTADIRNMPKYRSDEIKHCWTFAIYDKKLASDVTEYCGRYSKYKSINLGLLDWDDEAKKAFVAGYADSDGSYDAEKRTVRFGTISESIMYTLRSVILSMGYSPAIQVQMISAGFSKNKPPSAVYSMYLNEKSTAAFSDYSVKIIDNEEDKNRDYEGTAVITDEYHAFRVMNVGERYVEDETVYNMSVTQDESYIADGYAVHNCSICGHRAKSQREYCEDLRFNKLAIDDSGVMVFAYNDAPHFHDISRVSSPADRIAFGLSKVASGHVYTQEEKAGLYIPLDLIRQIAGKEERDRYELLHKLAEMEKEIPLKADKEVESLSESFVKEDGEEDEAVKKLKDIPIDKLLAALQKHNCMLTPSMFSRIVIKKKPGDIEGSEGFSKALKTVFGDLLNSDMNLEDLFEDGSYSPKMSFPDRSVEERVKELSEMLSLDTEPVQRRIIKITITGSPKKKLEKESSSGELTESAKYLAKEYAKYQLSFLANSKNEDNLLLAVLQNQNG